MQPEEGKIISYDGKPRLAIVQARSATEAREIAKQLVEIAKSIYE